MWLEPGPGYKSAAESLGEPIKEKGSSHLLARLKGINGFYGMHPGMQIGALQAGIIARFVSGGGRGGLHSYRVCNVLGGKVSDGCGAEVLYEVQNHLSVNHIARCPPRKLNCFKFSLLYRWRLG